jgi:flavin reductase (DIM6/NTAB) family NADH-FMN oxidoreductase RutF
MRRNLEPLDALRLLGGGPVVLVTTRWRDQIDVMPAIWVAPVSRMPPLVAVAVHPSRHSHDLMRFAEEFAINIPGRDLLNHVHYFGIVSGRDVSKLELAKLSTFKAQKVESPLIEGCLGHIECGLEDALRLGDHTLFVGRVVAVQADREAFEETWTLADPDHKPLHYLGIDRYAILAEPLEGQLRATEEGAIELGETKEDKERRQEEEAQGG